MSPSQAAAGYVRQLLMQKLAHRCPTLSLLSAISSCSCVIRAAPAAKVYLPAALPLVLEFHSSSAHSAPELCCSNATKACLSSMQQLPTAELQVRQAQIRVGDREVYVTEEGEKMSKLKQVDDAWILRRLERWGQKASWLVRNDPQQPAIDTAQCKLLSLSSILQSACTRQPPR